MQTFLPDPSFYLTASYLDNKRLNCQKKEALQILNVLEDPEAKGWKNHPAVLQWKGYTPALKLYFNTITLECIQRGMVNNLPLFDIAGTEIELPSWLGNEEYHSSHRAALLFKLNEYYSQFGWKEQPQINYYWPSKGNYDRESTAVK